VVLIILLASTIWSAAVIVPVRMHFGSVQDTVVVQLRAFNTVVSTFTKTATASVDTFYSLGDDTLWQVFARAHTPPDSSVSWTQQINRRSSNGPIDWPVEMYWAEPTDSTRVRFYKDSTRAPGTAFLITDKQSFDSAFTVYRDTAYSVIADLYYQGQTLPASWIWNCLWRRIDTGQIIATPSATKCRLYAFVKLPDGSPARGAVVTVTRGGAYNAVSSTSTRFVVTADAMSVRTDSLGKWTLDVIGSDQFSDTSNAFYNASCKWKSVELFNVRHIWCPANVSINVLDTLAAR
jgi:hypothetical protein